MPSLPQPSLTRSTRPLLEGAQERGEKLAVVES